MRPIREGSMNVRLRTIAVLSACVLVSACGAYVDGDELTAGPTAAGTPVPASGDLGEMTTAAEGEALAMPTGAGESLAVPGGGGGAAAGAPASGEGAAAAGAAAGATGTQAASAQREKKNDVGVSDTEIKLGVSAPLSGLLGFLGEEVVGAIDSHMKMVNAKGGIGGRKLKLVAYDDRLDPSLVLANTKRLVEQDKVFAVYGLFSDAVLEYVNQKKVPMITFGVTAPPFSSKYPTVFPLIGNAVSWHQESTFALTNHLGVKPKRVAVLYDTTLFDERGYLPYFKEVWEAVGAEVVSMDPVNMTDADCSSVAQKVRSLNIDYWDFQGLGWLLCASAMDRLGWKPPMGMGGWTTSVAGVGAIVGPILTGMLSGNQADQPTGAPRQKSAAHDEYVAAIAKYHPNLNNFGDLESPATTGYWVGTKIFVDGITAIAPTITRDELIKWMHGLKDYDVGIQPPIKSLAPDCKMGSGVSWWARWGWNAEKKEGVRAPESPYVSSPWADKYGGPCYVTKIADKIVGG
ncbi:MAG TPA: ABC transporter substrate-binding protein [Acidimicrobiales bacterium]|nr:ABC transporter substrate-binding protein [Acidimicrobiales bacterium]